MRQALQRTTKAGARGIKVQCGGRLGGAEIARVERTFEGKVAQVRQSPQTVQNVVTYDIVISVDNSDLALMPGLTAASRIVVDQRNDVTRVPNQALRYLPRSLPRAAPSDQARVWVLRDGEPVAVAVATGLDDDSFTEIVSGDLKPGDLVITAEQAAAANKVAMPRLGR
jgi:HlyD family secretion protein